MKTRPICRFCGINEASVQAHIVPQSFIRAHSVEGEPNYILSNREGHSRRTWTGVYDDALVCATCESGFNEFDRYGHQFFHAEQLTPIIFDGELFAWEHLEADGAKLKLFVLSILWRASASSRQEVRAVDLGRWERSVKKMIETNDPGTPDCFPVVLEKFDAAPGVAPTFYPYRTEIGNTQCYKMELAGCTAVMAIQGREWPPVLIEDIALAPQRPVRLLAKTYAGSQEQKRFHEIARDIIKRRGHLPGKRNRAFAAPPTKSD